MQLKHQSGRSPTSLEANGADPEWCPGATGATSTALGAFDAAWTPLRRLRRRVGSVLARTAAASTTVAAPTRTDEARLGVNLTYATGRGCGRRRTSTSACPSDRWHRTLDDDLLRLLGYAPRAYALGYVDDGTRPAIDVVRDRRRARARSALLTSCRCRPDLGSLIERAFVTTVVSFAATRAVRPPSKGRLHTPEARR